MLYQLSYASLFNVMQTTLLSYRERSLPSTMRNTKNANSTNVSVRYLPGSIVTKTDSAMAPSIASATTRRPVPAGLKSIAETIFLVLHAATQEKVVHRGGFEPP